MKIIKISLLSIITLFSVIVASDTEEIKTFVDEQEIGFAKIGIPLRLSLTGSLNSPSTDKVCELLGKKEVIERIDFAIKSF